ncbi:hypothetical protein NC652_003907 [Populus alba x Populus x berolinensis]|uniref:Uncharacterized protein n=1 Tax=Populus alba x Populus x berolinensis TaxID=444605 RepID=A0AAD6RSR2_9ROSI|nr:hypothetical protein NC652_003907 [Populus alba x Populus x berolinensis]KAJ7014460.1 hypothetical protein NC653_003932 [Populus alba x Populus x berolinensis]
MKLKLEEPPNSTVGAPLPICNNSSEPPTKNRTCHSSLPI